MSDSTTPSKFGFPAAYDPSLARFDLIAPLRFERGTDGADELTIDDLTHSISLLSGNDKLTLEASAHLVNLGSGNDELIAFEEIDTVWAGRGDDVVVLHNDARFVDLGAGDDLLKVSELITNANGGGGFDTLEFSFESGAVDVEIDGQVVTFIDRFSGEEMRAKNFEDFVFADRSFTFEELEDAFGNDADVPHIQVGGGTQVVTVNNADPTVSVIWDRVVQQAVIETDTPVGPTIASRAYAMMHTAMYDAWASFDDTAVRVSFDLEGDNISVDGGDLGKTKAMSFAAITVLRNLFPDQEELYATVMQDRLGFELSDDGSIAAGIGIDAAEDLLGLRSDDGSNQSGGYTGEFIPFNPSPLEINDITRWTPENVPVDPEDANPEQSFLTPQWQNVESFSLPEDASGETDFDVLLPAPPQPFFTDGFAGSTLNFDDRTITLDAPTTINGVNFASGETIPVSKDLIGTVINQGFIDQSLEVIEFSAELTDEDKIIAEFWEDGGGTAFPPGTFMAFAQFVSERDGHTIDDDAHMFMAMGNAVMDAGIATWQAKVFYDYVRPVRAIRDLGELGLIGEEGVDSITGETGFVIDAFGGIDPVTGEGLGTQTILAENFVTFQRPETDPSPPFAEYTSGHSAFSAAGAEVLRLFTGSDDFGGSVTFEPGSTQFEVGVPEDEETLDWATFTEAADEAGLSRLYGGIHFTEGDVNGRQLGRDTGAAAFDLAQSFINGTATDEDRPFFTDSLLF